MKKSLIAAALLGTFAASAFAAPSVTLYGRIDTGLAYTHQHWSADGAGDDSEYLYTCIRSSTRNRRILFRCSQASPRETAGA